MHMFQQISWSVLDMNQRQENFIDVAVVMFCLALSQYLTFLSNYIWH